MAEAEAEEHEPILEDVSDGDTDSDDGKGRTKKKDHCDDDDDEKEKEEMKLTEFHAKNYFNSTMGSKDLRVLFAMAIGCNSMDIPDHKDPPFCRSKTCHSEKNRIHQHSSLKSLDNGRPTRRLVGSRVRLIGKLENHWNIS